MNTIVKVLAFGVVNILIGYGIYPLVNTNMPIEEPQNITTLASQQTENIIIPPVLSTPTTNHKKVVQFFSPITRNEMKSTAQTTHHDEGARKTTKAINNQIDDEPNYQALNHWTKLHKEKLFETITANVPDELAGAMKNIISEDNDFLNNPELLQAPHKDENWAYITEQDVRNLIIQNPLSTNFNLLKLTCKQLICEVLGSESITGIWRKIYWSLLQTLPTLKKPDSSNTRDSITFSDEGMSYIYFKLKFTEEVDSY